MTGRRQPTGGVLLLDKPAGPTSHEVVQWVRWCLRERRVGHTGTLDPAATGLLVVCIGSATKLVPYLTAERKRYAAEIVVGVATTTGDAQGEILAAHDITAAIMAEAPGELRNMVGSHRLAPPAFSAVKIAGKRAHELARAGTVPVLEPREMVVHLVQDIAVHGHVVRAVLEVDKGTYVRSLAEELGRRLGVVAHLGALRRIAAGCLVLDRREVVGGLRAEPYGDARDGSPRWRIRPADPGGSRLAMGEDLRSRLLAPGEVLSMPVWELHGSSDERDAVGRLARGQRLSQHHAGLLGAMSGAVPGLVAVRGAGGLLIARVEVGPDGRTLELAPERTIEPPAGAGASRGLEDGSAVSGA